MKQEEVENKIVEMLQSEFLKSDEIDPLSDKIDAFIKDSNNNIFGYNDGEPLELDGLEFVLQLIKYKWMLANAIYEE